MTIRPCPVCYEYDSEKIVVINKGKKYSRVFCKNCATSFFNKLINKKPVYDYDYNAHFHRLGDIRKARIMGKKIVALALTAWEKPSVFEIGVGNGLTLAEIKQHGIPVAGVDIDKKLCSEISDHLAAPIYAGGLITLKTKNKYKIVYTSHVIEHFEDPYEFMHHAIKLMDTDGILYLDTPDMACNKTLNPKWHHFRTRNPLEHCCVLSSKSICRLANHYNMKVIWFKSFKEYDSFQVILTRNKILNTQNL